MSAPTKDQPKGVTAEVLKEFVDSKADFSFEMQVLNELIRLGFKCQHSGAYRDDRTQKIREYDIRANFLTKRALVTGNTFEKHDLHFLLAVECKALSKFRPLLCHRVPRTNNEAFHTMLAQKGPNKKERWTTNWSKVKVTGRESVYKPEQLVSKDLDLVKHTASIRSEGDAFDKLTQALASCAELAAQALQNVKADGGTWFISPVLVVPDGQLWAVDYDRKGNITEYPRQVEFVEHFINWPVGELTFSHLEICTISNLQTLKNKLESRLNFSSN